ncbi:MAG: NAD(P)/FAD-dependent oxidoreductase [Bacillati bacterium ANGP1]|uniref:Pyridine nucleotide-disulfide oxidoreductase domain-containing protein 2 n=1 Tax=Candidatus Segetimicrobium genomatis TaxID=2569760 RepID=A0A537JER8_9BACT|nr:MAG: NAD(P)/FAD-dependent oxidoreductase [Terrabacteria group bacterium ANGP1]
MPAGRTETPPKNVEVGMKRYDVVVVGGGHNGLTAACYLAKAGLSVVVLERRDVVGGACVTEELFPGFRLNVASYTIGMFQPEIVRELGLREAGFFSYVRDPQFTGVFPDGRHLVVYPDLERTVADVARLSRRDAEAWPRFEADAARVGAILREHFLRPADNWTWADFARSFSGRDGERLLARFILGTTRNLVETYFESEAVKGVLAFGGAVGTFVGPSTPGSAYSKAHHLAARVDDCVGCFGYVRGGMGALSQALATILRRNGGEIRTGVTVEHVLIREGVTTGVVLAGGEEISARIVLSNADPRQTLLGLVGERALDPDVVGDLRRYRTTGCSYKINCTLDALPRFRSLPPGDQTPYLRGGVVISPSLDYLETAYRDARAGRVPRRPYVIAHFQSITDPGLAPPGKHTMTLYGDWVPYQPADGPWTPERRRAFVEDVFDTLAEHAPNIRDVIRDWMVLVPPDIEARFNITGGNIFHGDLTLEQLFSLRPIPGFGAHRMPVANLYLCGSGSHPGGYVSGLPGRNAATVVLRDLER